MRSAGQRARRVKSARRDRSPLAVAAAVVEEERPRNDVEQDEEKIEVHVHVHRGGAGATTKKRKKRRRFRLDLTGSLADWQGHYDRVYKGPPPPGEAGVETPAVIGDAHSLICTACGAAVPKNARSCRRCEAPMPRSLFSRLRIALALGAVLGVFAVCYHFLGDSVREHRPPEPLRADFTEDEPYVIGVGGSPSPFQYDYATSRLKPISGTGAAE